MLHAGDGYGWPDTQAEGQTAGICSLSVHCAFGSVPGEDTNTHRLLVVYTFD